MAECLKCFRQTQVDSPPVVNPFVHLHPKRNQRSRLTKFHSPCGEEEAMDLWEQMDKNDEICFESYYDTENFDFLRNGIPIICRTHDAHAQNPLLCNRFWIVRRNPQEKKDGIVYDEKA